MTNQLITYRLPIDYSLISLMSLMWSISYVWLCVSNYMHFRVFACKVQVRCVDTACNVRVVHALYGRVMLQSLWPVLLSSFRQRFLRGNIIFAFIHLIKRRVETFHQFRLVEFFNISRDLWWKSKDATCLISTDSWPLLFPILSHERSCVSTFNASVLRLKKN